MKYHNHKREKLIILVLYAVAINGAIAYIIALPGIVLKIIALAILAFGIKDFVQFLKDR